MGWSKEKRPARSSGGGGNYGSSGGSWFPAFHLKEETSKGLRHLDAFYVSRGGADVPIVLLDEGDKKGDSYTLQNFVRLHFNYDYGVKPNGKKQFSNITVCTQKTDPRGCPICDDGNCNKKSQFYNAGTVLNRTSFKRKAQEGEQGDKDGKITVNSKRQILIIAEQKIDEFDGTLTKCKGGRGHCFDVSRTNEQTSPRNGTSWWPTGKMSEQDMLETFSDDAVAYGMTPEQYIEPIDYATVLNALPHEELVKIVEAIRAETLGEEAVVKEAAAMQKKGNLADDEAVPF